PAAQAGAPGGMEPRGERADRDRLQSLVERFEAHDHRRSRLGHLRALDGIEISPTDLVALHRFPRARRRYFGPRSATTRGLPASQGISSRPSARVTSQAPQSSASDAISRAVSSQESLGPTGPGGRSRMPSLRSSITTVAPMR